MRKKILVTGGCGFIGSHFVRFILGRRDYEVINLDALTYAGNPQNLRDCADDERYTFVHGDICDEENVMRIMEGVAYVVHCAAESHVDRSIESAHSFIETNVRGTHVLVECARKHGVERFLHVSTDEVYGSLKQDGYFTEHSPLQPNSPYAASKASSDLIVRSYIKTYGLPALITRCSNNYGPYQFPEKLIPLMITNALNDIPLPVYGDGMNVRDWLYVEDHCRALDVVLHEGELGEVYNIGGNNEWHNIDIVKEVLNIVKKPESLISFVPDRLGHDRRYAIDASKMRDELGWEPRMSFSEGLRETVYWYVKNPAWVDAIREGTYQR